MERTPRPEVKPGRLRLSRAARALLACLAVSALAAACKAGKPSFGALLARIDSGQPGLSELVYDNAAAMASSTEERLRILRRARERGASTYARVAAAVLERCPSCAESVALAALDAYLADGRHEESLSLFDGPLDYGERPLEYAEAFVACVRAGSRPAVGPERLVAASDATGDRRFVEYAAVRAMMAGDRPLARVLLVGIPSAGQMPEREYRLLWDAGALDELAARPVDGDDPLGLAVKADADYLRGDFAAASAGYAELIERQPFWSWKPYAALARPAALVPPEATLAGHYLDLSLERFPGDDGAMLERARWLLASGRLTEAAEAVASLSGESAAIVSLACADARLAVTLALRMVADYPASAAVADAALETLAERGAWKDFSGLWERSRDAGLVTARAWFWDALASALAGDYEAAERRLAEGGRSFGEYAEAMNKGVILAALRRYDEASAFLGRAAALAPGAEGRAEALVLAGDSARLSGRLGEARGAYEAALGADPASREARSRLERLRYLEKE